MFSDLLSLVRCPGDGASAPRIRELITNNGAGAGYELDCSSLTGQLECAGNAEEWNHPSFALTNRIELSEGVHLFASRAALSSST
jgi:hypothetical protein